MMLYSIFTRHLTCCTWYMIYDTGTRYWHRHLICYTWYLFHGTWYLDTSIWHMSYLTPAPDTRYMTCFHVVQVHWLDIVTLDRHHHPWYLYYMTYFWLSLLRGLGMIIILLPDIWYSWTPILLNSCILEPLKYGGSWHYSWYYTPVDPRNRITMDIGLLWIPCGLYYLTLCYI